MREEGMMSLNGMARPCSYPVRRRVSPGISTRKEPSHVWLINAIPDRYNRHRYWQEHLPPGGPIPIPASYAQATGEGCADGEAVESWGPSNDARSRPACHDHDWVRAL